MTARAAVLRSIGAPFTIEELDLEPPQKGEVLIRMGAAGVCHSDWHLVTGATQHPLPVVAGHEGAGIVEAVGAGVTHLAPGDTVALNWAPSCGVCFYCLRGRPSLCQSYVDRIWHGVLLDGTSRFHDGTGPITQFSSLGCFADRTVIPDVCCVKLPNGFPLPIAALIGCAVATGVGAVLNTAKVEAGSSVVVFGAGGVGLSAVLGARLAGCDPIIAIDRTQEKADAAKPLGASHALAAGEDLLAQVRALTGGRGADYVFEAIGSPPVQELCVKMARPGGAIVFAGIAPTGSGTNVSGADLTRQEKTVTGSYYGTSHPARDFPMLADLYRSGRLPLDRLVTKTYELDQINEAYHDLLAGKLSRGVIVWP